MARRRTGRKRLNGRHQSVVTCKQKYPAYQKTKQNQQFDLSHLYAPEMEIDPKQQLTHFVRG
jgi:hypothetical protein